MLNLGAPELLVILVVGLLVLGPTRLPQAARQVGTALGELRRMSSGFQAEVQQAMSTAPQEPPEPVERLRRTTPLRAAPVDAADESED